MRAGAHTWLVGCAGFVANRAARTEGALQNLDLPMIMATVMYASMFVVIANAVVDFVYILLDPRLRAS